MTNTAEIEKLIQSDENESLEFKSNFNNKLIETMVAFANTSGGKVFVGINQNNKVVGVMIHAETVQNWINETTMNNTYSY